MQRHSARVARAAALILVALLGSACVGPSPAPDPAVLAVAYSNLDGIDGYDPSGGDVLVSKLVDQNRDGVVSVGDSVITDRYPLDLDATAFGSFQNTTHMVDEVWYADSLFVHVGIVGGGYVWYSLGEPGPPFYEPFEQYVEAADDNSSWVQIIDRHPSAPHLDQNDWVMLHGTPPSLPEHELSVSTPREPDDDFLDVDLFV